ncbi:MAG: diguanylate cyclase [Gottschalkiaceae bacterium]|nr:MAG: diguanylate cyclase [Gottschalkiaceae bacterium]
MNISILFKKYRSSFLYSLGTVLIGIIMSFGFENITVATTTSSLLFIALMISAYIKRKNIAKKYILSLAAFTVLFISVQYFPYRYNMLPCFVFYLPLIYAYLLRDILIVNIIGILIAYIFSLYTGQAELYEIITNVIGTISNSISCSLLFYLYDKITMEQDKYHKLSMTDSLTGLFTLKYIIKTGRDLLYQGHSISLLILDIKDFESINNTYGHIAGDRVLKQIGDCIKNVLIDYNAVIGRLGGDEFIVLLYDCPTWLLNNIAAMLYTAFEENKFSIDPELDSIEINCSIGKAQSMSGYHANIEELVQKANTDLLYNKIIFFNSVFQYKSFEYELPDSCRQLLQVLEDKDMYTYVHSKYVAQYAVKVGEMLKLSDNKLRALYTAGLLHDIGKILIPGSILRKPIALTEQEHKLLRQHVVYGLKILETCNLGSIEIDAIKNHHERWDGFGYPFSISSRNTSVESRILQVADVFSAMTINRIYRERLTIDEALAEIRKNAGTQLDPEISAIFCDMIQANKNSFERVG